MKTIKYTLYIALMFFASVPVYASPSEATKSLSTAMFIYIPSVLAAILVSYFIWRMNGIKRRQSTPKTQNRGPVKRPVVAYQKRKALHDV